MNSTLSRSMFASSIQMDDSSDHSLSPPDEEDNNIDEGSEDRTISLIRCVRERSFLYTKSDKRYSDRNLTERTWTQIASELGLTKDEVKQQWTRLRNNFSKMLSRRKAKAPSGSASVTPHKPWLYEAEMEFLKRHISQSKTLSSSMDNSSTINHTPCTTTSQPTEVESQAEDIPVDGNGREEIPQGFVTAEMETTAWQNQKRTSKSPNNSALDQAIITYVQTMTDKTEDPLLMWFKGILPSLRALSPGKVSTFQINMMQELHRLNFQDQPQLYSQYPGGATSNQHSSSNYFDSYHTKN